MKRLSYVISAVALAAFGSTAVLAMQHQGGSQALESSNAAMHEAMAVETTGDVDIDFMRMMIPHHQGAVEMARIVIENGTDPEVRKLAEGVVKAQEAEIAFMKTWLEKNGAGQADGTATDHSAH